MAISNENNVEENLPIMSDNLNDLVCKQINLFLENKLNVLKETSHAFDTNDLSTSKSCKTYVKKMYHLSFVILAIVIVVCATLLIFYSPLFKERISINPKLNIYQPANDSQENRYLPVPSSTPSETKPGILLFLDTKQLKEHKTKNYDVAWERKGQSFVQGNISFNGSNIYIGRSGTYVISCFLQMEIQELNSGTLCHLILTSNTTQTLVHHRYNVPKNVSSNHRFIMSLTLIYKLEVRQMLSISMTPSYYLSHNEDSSFLSIYMI